MIASQTISDNSHFTIITYKLNQNLFLISYMMQKVHPLTIKHTLYGARFQVLRFIYPDEQDSGLL